MTRRYQRKHRFLWKLKACRYCGGDLCLDDYTYDGYVCIMCARPDEEPRNEKRGREGYRRGSDYTRDSEDGY